MAEAPGHPVTREAAHTLGKAADAINAAADAIAKLGDAAKSANESADDWKLQAAIDLARARCRA